MATGTVRMPKVPMGFRCPEEEVLPRMRHAAAD